VLDNSPYKWLHEMLEVFNTGDLHAYDALCSKYASVLNGQPALVEHERRLREKVCVFGGGGSCDMVTQGGTGWLYSLSGDCGRRCGDTVLANQCMGAVVWCGEAG
jgi:hypothetical protein